jgi:hypothetical protein
MSAVCVDDLPRRVLAARECVPTTQPSSTTWHISGFSGEP